MPFVYFCLFGLLLHGLHGKTSCFGENFAHLTQLAQTVYDILEKFFPGTGLDLVHPGAGSLIGSRPRHLGPVFRMNETMRKFCLALALVAGLSAVADAGPFHRRGRAVAVAAVTTTQAKPAAKPAVQGDTSTAQGVALLIVNTGRFRHWGGYSGFEGIGMGATPEAAEANCCYRSRWAPRERAFARMANGMWVCVCRY